MDWFFTTLKKLIWANSECFSAKNLKTRFFQEQQQQQQKSQFIRFYFAITSSKKLEKFHALTFHITFGPKSPKQDVFPENRAPSLLKLDKTLPLCNNSENSYEWFWRKALDKRTNVPTYREYFKGPSLCSSKTTF